MLPTVISLVNRMGQLIEQKCVMIIAGEASGDLHGAKLVRAMRKKDNALFFCGIGGAALKNAGVRIAVDSCQLSVVGITEVFSKMPGLFKGMSVAKKLLKSLHPDLLILIDFPDFNLHVASVAKKLNIPVLYYISPQVWAWRTGRVKKIRRLVDHVAVILPFEEGFFKKHDVPVTFVGHPLLDIDSYKTDPRTEKKTGAENVHQKTVIGLLPGSRDREIERHLPVMLAAARLLTGKIPNVKFCISLAPSVERKYVEERVSHYLGTDDFELSSDNVGKIFARSKLVVAVSGTVTLEAAMTGTPMVIIYKISPVSYWLVKNMAKVEHIGLVNLIAGKGVVPELIQDKASPENIADTVLEMLRDAAGLELLRNELLAVRDVLGGPGVSDRVADLAITML